MDVATEHQRIYAERLREEYRDVAPIAQRFCDALKDEILQLLRHNSVTLGVPLEARVKAWSSIEEKLTRIHFHSASLTELEDLVGLRVILLFKRDLERTCRLISKTFRVLHQRDKSDQLGEKEFGYQSVHFVVKLPKQWLNLPSFSAFEEFQAEIQVRTLAQHIWAAASHVLQYKQEAAVPLPVRRSINRVSALLEVVDLEFQRVLNERDAYQATLKDKAPDRPLNVDVLAAILDEFFPKQNKRPFEAYSLLLWELQALGIHSSGQLRELIERNLDAALDKEAESVGRRKEYFDAHPGEDRPTDDVFFAHSGLLRMVLEEEFGQHYYGRIWDSKMKSRQSDTADDEDAV